MTTKLKTVLCPYDLQLCSFKKIRVCEHVRRAWVCVEAKEQPWMSSSVMPSASYRSLIGLDALNRLHRQASELLGFSFSSAQGPCGSQGTNLSLCACVLLNEPALQPPISLLDIFPQINVYIYWKKYTWIFPTGNHSTVKRTIFTHNRISPT